MSKAGKFVHWGIIIVLCLAMFGFNNVQAQEVEEVSLLPMPATWVDHFSTASLDGAWTWIREDPTRWSLTANTGYMRLFTHGGSLYQDINDLKNMLIQSAPATNFLIETKVDFEPTENFQAAGLLLYFDDDNYLALLRAYCDRPAPTCLGNGIYFDKEVAGVAASENFPTTTVSLSEAYLRIVRTGDLYTGYFSEDGTNWTLVGSHELVTDPLALLGSLRIGIMAGQNGSVSAADIPADFDYFKLITPTFSDVLPNHWAYQYIDAIFRSGLTSGYPDGTFRPENPVTRAEMAVFLLGGMGVTPPAINGSHPFSDIAGHWAEPYIEELFDLGVTGGYPDGTFKPEQLVTRAEMAVFLLNGMGVTPPALDGSHPFSDISSHWAETFIEELYDLSITGGYPDGTYRPENQVTRAEMAVFLVNAFGIPIP